MTFARTREIDLLYKGSVFNFDLYEDFGYIDLVLDDDYVLFLSRAYSIQIYDLEWIKFEEEPFDDELEDEKLMILWML